MKIKIVLLLCLLLILVSGVLVYFHFKQPSSPYNSNAQVSPTISVSPTSANSLSYCLPDNLEADLILDHAAGNVYGKITLKNISNTKCQILNGVISADYDMNTVKNISINYTGSPSAGFFTLSPNQTIYSQVHFPNGPQCQSVGINTIDVTFSYKISPENSVAFKNQNGDTKQQITTCKSPNDITQIQIWNMSTSPIVP